MSLLLFLGGVVLCFSHVRTALHLFAGYNCLTRTIHCRPFWQKSEIGIEKFIIVATLIFGIEKFIAVATLLKLRNKYARLGDNISRKSRPS